MPELRTSGNAVWGVAIALAALLMLYIVAYYASVKPMIISGFGTVLGDWDGVYPAYYPPIGPQPADEWVETAFAPMYWIDRRIRPHAWDRGTLFRERLGP